MQVRAAEHIQQTHLPESIWKGLPSFINLSFSIVKVGAAAALAAAHRQKSPKSRGDMVDNRKQRSGAAYHSHEPKSGVC